MNRGRLVATAVALALFAASRGFLLFAFQPDQSDMYLYFQYAWEDEVARQQGRPLYAFHLEQFERARAHAEATGASPPPAETRSIEYPPAALQAVLWPKLFADRPAVVPWRPHDWPPLGHIPGYEPAFRRFMAAFDAVGFAALLLLVPRFFPGERAPRHLERWITYVGAGHLLGHLIYDRLSLPPGVLLLGAAALLTLAHVPAAVALALLAAAVNYQLSPVVLVPAFVLGALTARRVHGGAKALLAGATLYGLLAAAWIVALFLPFYVREGPESLAFLRYHGQRGLQIESIAATLPLLLSFAGHAVQPVGEFGAVHLRSSLAPLLARSSPPAMLALVLGATAGMLIAARRHGDAVRDERLAVSHPSWFIAGVVACLAAAIATSKVFSPQYLLWLMPLVPLLPSRAPLPMFLVVAALTTAIFPYAYVPHVTTPTTAGKLLLAARNTAFIVFGVMVLLSLRRPGRTGPTQVVHEVDARALVRRTTPQKVVGAPAGRGHEPEQ